MWKRLGFALVIAFIFTYAWRTLDRIPINVVGQPSMTGVIQSKLEQPFFENLAKTTGLPLDIDYQPIDALGIKDDYQLRLVKSGALDLVSLRFLQNATVEPTLLGVDLLGLTLDFATAHAVVEAYAPVMDRRLQENFNAKLLGIWPFGPQVFFCRHAITGLADMAGRKIRVGNDNFVPLVSAFGGTPVVIPFDDVKDALKNGLVDCAISSAGSGNYAGWAEHSTHYYPLGTQMGLNGYVISLNLWNRLSRNQQNEMERAFQRHVDQIWAYAKEVHDDASGCNVGKPCRQSKLYHLVEVQPKAGDYQLIRELFERTTFKDWAARCERVYPGCANDWRARVEPVISRTQTLTPGFGRGQSK